MPKKCPFFFGNSHNTKKGDTLTSLTRDIDQKLFFLNKDLIFMVSGLCDLNCSNSVCVKLPFLGREDHSKKEKKRGKSGEKEKNIQHRQEFSLSDKETETNKKLNSFNKENSEKVTTNKKD